MDQPIEKPVGIILIAIYNIFDAVSILFILLMLLLLFGTFLHSPPISFILFGFTLLVIIFAFVVVLFKAAFGLWQFKPWAWSLNYWLYLLAIPLMILFLIIDKDLRSLEGLFSVGVSLVASIAIVLYLRREPIKRLYQKI